MAVGLHGVGRQENELVRTMNIQRSPYSGSRRSIRVSSRGNLSNGWNDARWMDHGSGIGTMAGCMRVRK